MKNKTITPTDHEKVMRETDFIVSKTDPKGRITYGNRIFYEFAGYTEEELIGVQHNIVRHPDMPRCVFNLLWLRLTANEEIFAYVKNLSKDGSFYWVYANVTPSIDVDGKVVGHYSVRRKPSDAAMKIIPDVYTALLAEEAKHPAKMQIAAGTALLEAKLNELGVTYDQFVYSLQSS